MTHAEMLSILKMAANLTVLQAADADSAPGIVLGEIKRAIAESEGPAYSLSIAKAVEQARAERDAKRAAGL